MHLNNYFEKLNFDNGKKINVSKKIDINFSGKMHWHPFIEILVSLKDHNEVTINFTPYTLKTNDLVIIYPGDLHSFAHVDEDAFILVQFPLDLLMIMGELNNNVSVFSQFHCIKYDPSDVDADRMIFLIKQLPDLFYSDALFNEVLIYSLLLEFFVKLGRYCLNAKKEGFSGDASADYKSTKLMAEACLYISQNCTQPLTLEDVAQHIGVSKYHFSRIFNKYTNMTFIDFLTTERIKRTESLILNPNARITDIAFESGFSSVSSFNRVFKKIKGITPSEFRETMIDNAFQSQL